VDLPFRDIDTGITDHGLALNVRVCIGHATWAVIFPPVEIELKLFILLLINYVLGDGKTRPTSSPSD
jgi:hypothetical protein